MYSPDFLPGYAAKHSATAGPVLLVWNCCALFNLPQARLAPCLRPDTLLAVQLDDELLVDRQLDVLSLRQRKYFPAHVVAVGRQPLRLCALSAVIARDFKNR